MVDYQTLENEMVGNWIIPSEKVAHVQMNNSLEHALLVLTRTGYTAIPVLDSSYRFHGLISMPKIMDAILGIERIEFEKLETLKVGEFMSHNIPRFKAHYSLYHGLEALVNNPFLCVVDGDDQFLGILTRRVLLKQWKKDLIEAKEIEAIS
ncbi:MAG: cyclic-di-AMP-binding protein CbpB [Bacilli bacterium]